MTSTLGTAETVLVDVQSQQTPNASIHPNSQNTTTIDRLTFPRDFPTKPPSGITLISFSAWKEHGICVNPRPDDPEELEVDTYGIPTVAMPKVHSTDRCKTNTKRKKMKTEAKRKALESGGKAPPWWEQWEEDEDVRIAKPTNASDSRVSKFIAAATDFRTGRRWPLPVNHQIDPQSLWDKVLRLLSYDWNYALIKPQIQFYLGIESQKPKTKLNKKVYKEILEEEMSDDEMMFLDEPEECDGIAETKDKKVVSFLNDPERSVKIFLSSYARAKGFLWSKINLEQVPWLWIFFLKFLLRSRVFPRSEADFKAALAVAQQALVELPLTGEISCSTPDDFSRGCKELWGSRAETFKGLDFGEDWVAQMKAEEKIVELSEEKQPGTANADLPDVNESEQASEPQQEGGVSWGHSAWNGGEDSGGGWGEPSIGWGNGGDEGWANALELVHEEEAAADAAMWETPPEERPFVMRLMGPTLLPLTHTTGVVEQSLRRITDLIPIPTNIPPKPAVAQDEPIVMDPAGVEAELETQFPKVVLSPWLNWDGGELPEFSEPRILDTSQGAVVDPPYATRNEGDAAPATNAHDPGNDTITVLVQQEVFDKLLKGMCLAGIWVQIIRQPIEPSEEGPAKKKRKGKKKAPANFWYMEEVSGVFPSYWTTKST